VASTALVADLPSRKAPPAALDAPLWTGFNKGLNAGYKWGTNSNAYSYALGGQNGDGLPPEKWSSLKYGFLNPRGGIIDEQEAL
jgi:hypothetical protein